MLHEKLAIVFFALADLRVRDLGRVEDSSDIDTGYALINGRRTVYIPVTKRADALCYQ